MKHCLFLIILILSYYQLYSQKDTTRAFGDIVNAEITSAIKKMPPIIGIRFYENGNNVYAGFSTSLLLNGKEIKYSDSTSLFVDTTIFKPGDSIYFCVKYKKLFINTFKFDYRRFLHGGELTVGVLYNYYKEEQKYNSDSSEYFLKNEGNYLYDFISRAKNVDKKRRAKKLALEYCVVRSNITALTSYKFDLIDSSQKNVGQ